MSNTIPKVTPPINIKKWISENSHLLKPPVSNHCIYSGKDFTIMLISGPNQRRDYHVNQTEEWFFQLQGGMDLQIVQGSENDRRFDVVRIEEGDMFLLPGNVPHSPRRYENTLGLVIELPRPENVMDSLRWYCIGCKELVYEETFHVVDLKVQLKEVIDRWMEGDQGWNNIRKCKHCGIINPKQ